MRDMAIEIRRLRKAELEWKSNLPPSESGIPTQSHSQHLSRLKKSSDSEGTSDSDEPAPRPQPGITRLPWDEFKDHAAKHTNQLDLSKLSVIEVLADMPMTAVSWVSRASSLTPSFQPPPDGHVTGQGPLPERIRIRSPRITWDLQIITGKALYLWHEGGTPAGLSYLLRLGHSVVTMTRPFRTLVHFKDQIKERVRRLEDSPPPPSPLWRADTAHLRCLTEFIDSEIQPKIDWVDGNDCDKVSFSDLWFLFKPGDEIIQRENCQAYRVILVFSTNHRVPTPRGRFDTKSGYKEDEDEGDEHQLMINCIWIDFDGTHVGPVLGRFVIGHFNGEKAITSLEVYPLRFAEKKTDREQGKTPFRDQLINRGKMFLDLLSMKQMHYSGPTVGDKTEVDSQVFIDFEKAFLSPDGSRWKPPVVALTGTESRPFRDTPCRSPCCLGESMVNDSYLETVRNEAYLASLKTEDASKGQSIALYPGRPQDINTDVAITDDDYVIMSYVAFGFVFHTRKWAQFDLQYLTPVRYPSVATAAVEKGETIPRQLAFDQLVLPDGYKDMVLSLIAQHYRDKASQKGQKSPVDIVRGKGEGLILLLHGAPGVGKTTTAEGVAEMFQKPLLQITCGDLGSTASEVEAALETHFALASRWGCILLLDEADVFLAARTPQDFIRNGMVSVFLRVLEYYTGILFLATNRVGDFDEAFGSRIHISLHYPQLDLSSTLKVFELNLNLIRERFKRRNRELTIDTRAILEHAAEYWTKNEHMRWNGRQIRNACNTALALAEFAAQGGDHTRVVDAGAKISLKLEHIEVVSTAYLGFITYLEDVFDKDADRRAKQMMIRAREYKKSTDKGGTCSRQGSHMGRPPSFSGGVAQVPMMAAHATGQQQGLWPPMSQQHAQSPSPTSSVQSPGYSAAANQMHQFHNHPSHLTAQQPSQPPPGQTYTHYTFGNAQPQGLQPGGAMYQQPHQAYAMAGPIQTQAQGSAQPAGWPATAYPSTSMPTNQAGQVVPAPQQITVPIMEPSQSQP
ncbi:hypothetical protein QBC41DRAFT_331599 [Cercophora samala]|uniref:AAA+ ATPase domain-containing protein n=1 Tax=Cercophora samala TaxID=330535 RepID=A0AA40D1D4_9PEZI|nr:hypothetical protein QBC41DRAFT_331599 [Cercophora samala]